MNKTNLLDSWLPLLLIIVIGGFLLWGVELVPFHPDESTQIFMSNDFNLLFTDPVSMSWDPEKSIDNPNRLRALDAPITKYLIGLARSITSTPSLESDWDWSLSWQENQKNGAIPSSDLLSISRFVTAILIPISLVLFYDSAKSLFDRSTALLAFILLGINPLIMLHARRAMAESALLLGVCFFLWTLSREKIRPWLVGFSLIIAINAKQTSIALIPAGIIAVCWLYPGPIKPKLLIRRVVTLSVILVGATFILNPFYWKHPLQSAQVSVQTRNVLAEEQVSDFSPQFGTKQTLPFRVLSLIGNLYLTQPSYAETGNYLDATKSQVDTYFSVPLHNVGRSLIAGSIQIVLTAAGLIMIISKSLPSHPANRSKSLILIWIGFFCQLVFTITAIHLPWQRYVIPLLPFTSLFTAISLSPFQAIFTRDHNGSDDRGDTPVQKPGT